MLHTDQDNEVFMLLRHVEGLQKNGGLHYVAGTAIVDSDSLLLYPPPAMFFFFKKKLAAATSALPQSDSIQLTLTDWRWSHNSLLRSINVSVLLASAEAPCSNDCSRGFTARSSNAGKSGISLMHSSLTLSSSDAHRA